MNNTSDPRLEFSDWLHDELVRECAGETESWALERAARVQRRINGQRAGRPALETTILWVAPPLAFTLAGRHVYVARSLFQRLPSDDAVAFVLAHEAAHHDLGHLDLFEGWARWLPQSRASGYVAMLARLFEHHTYGPERELAADEYAIRLALKAGFDGDLAAQALSILEQLALDHGDIDGVFGPENLLDPTDPGNGSTGYRVQRWVWTHLHGYLPLHERATHVRRLARTLRGAVARGTPNRASAAIELLAIAPHTLIRLLSGSNHGVSSRT
jgi:Zn-dependent protease with chaperone function